MLQGSIVQRIALGSLRYNKLATCALSTRASGRLLVRSNVWRDGRMSAAVCPTPSNAKKPHEHALHFKIERIFTVGMFPLFPAALFFHNPFMDYALAVAISLHTYWGLDAVCSDYATPLGFKESSLKFIHAAVFLVCLSLFVGLLRFNYNDVGITKAFEMIWTL